jgi:hypothetical protein
MAKRDFESFGQPSMSPAPIEVVLRGSKLPWRPKAAGYVALFLGPMAGALVAAASLRRMGQAEKAKKTVLYSILLCIAFLVPFLLGIPPDAPIKKIILLAVEGAGYSVFPSILREDCVKWKSAHPGLKPRNDWATAGWGILGAIMYIGLAVMILMFRLRS